MNFKPARRLILPNDKLTKTLFKISEKTFSAMIDTEQHFFINEGEKKIKSKTFDVKSYFWVKSTSSTEPPSMFDRAVMSACISELLAGNTSTTPAIIYRTLSGKHQHFQSPTKRQYAQILASVIKLKSLLIKIDMKEVCKQFNYNSGKPLVIDYTPILPCHISKGDVGGGESESVIFFEDTPPLLKIAQVKNNQLITFDNKLLDIGEKHTGANMAAVKFYVSQRVFETIQQKWHNAAITFDDLFKKCRMSDASRDKKMKCRNAILSLMANFVDADIIKSFEYTKVDGKFYSVKFTY